MGKPNTTLSQSSRRGIVAPILLWLVFGAGLTAQLFSPHLPIEHNSFVISGDAVPPGSVVDPRALVARQRFMQTTSAVLVLVAVIGLAFWYREALSRSLTRTGA
jgi:hypothetical protein